VVLSVEAHKFFEREGDDLHCVLPISFPQARWGRSCRSRRWRAGDDQNSRGNAEWRQFKLRSKGVPHLNSHGKGDLVVEVRVATPSKLNREQKELLRQLSETMTVENTPTNRGFSRR